MGVSPHLQSILLEFDADGAPEESTLIRLFREMLEPLVKAQMEQHGWETWISAAHKVTVRLIPPWPSSRRQPGILKMSPPHPPLDILNTSRHTLRGSRMAKPPTRKSGRKKKSLRRLVTVLITSALKRLT